MSVCDSFSDVLGCHYGMSTKFFLFNFFYLLQIFNFDESILKEIICNLANLDGSYLKFHNSCSSLKFNNKLKKTNIKSSNLVAVYLQ